MVQPCPPLLELPAGAPDVAFHMAVDDFLQAFSDVQACGAANYSRYFAFPDDCVRAWRRGSGASWLGGERGAGEARLCAC